MQMFPTTGTHLSLLLLSRLAKAGFFGRGAQPAEYPYEGDYRESGEIFHLGEILHGMGHTEGANE
jgi:hypothetical protein